MSQKPILTQDEVKQYVTKIMMAFRQDIEREMAASGAAMEAGHEFYSVLHDLALRFELDPGQQAVICGVQAQAWLNPPDTPLILAVSDNGSGPQIRKVSDLSPGERARFEANWRRLVANCQAQPHNRTVGELIEAGEWPN